MPPFRLELPEKINKLKERNLRIIPEINKYDPKVKVAHREKHYEIFPVDNHPYCHNNINCFLSHYNRLGQSCKDEFTTTTKDMLDQVHTKQIKIPPEYHIVNCYTYNKDIKDNAIEDFCEDNFWVRDYVTTMQNSYQSPYPCRMERLTMSKTPFLENRHFRNEASEKCTTKFYDDQFEESVCLLRKHKRARWAKFNPVTNVHNSY